MTEKESTFEYGFDFSNNDYDDDIPRNDKFEKLITAAAEQLIKEKRSKVIDEKQLQKAKDAGFSDAFIKEF